MHVLGLDPRMERVFGSHHAPKKSFRDVRFAMVAPLKVGIAGLGTVGAEVVRLIEEQGRALSARIGRGVRVVAVTARSKAKKRGVSLDGIAWAKNPQELASAELFTPPTAPPAPSTGQLTGGRRSPNRSDSHEPVRMPRGLPTT